MSAEPDIDQLYEQQIKLLPRAARLRLLARIARGLADEDESRRLSVMGLEGLGAEIWRGVDVQAYIDAERDSWDRQ
jgi:hypothetical protein